MSDTQLVTDFVATHPYWVLAIAVVCYGSMLIGLALAIWDDKPGKGSREDNKQGVDSSNTPMF